MQAKAQVQLTDEGNAPDIYADNLAGLVVSQGNFSMTFAAIRADHAQALPSNTRNIALRLVMPTSAVADLHAALGRVLKEMDRTAKSASDFPPEDELFFAPSNRKH
jgi:hypothetical protein